MRGAAAAGARLAVWWDGEQAFFEGVFVAYDAVSTRWVADKLPGPEHLTALPST